MRRGRQTTDRTPIIEPEGPMATVQIGNSGSDRNPLALRKD